MLESGQSSDLESLSVDALRELIVTEREQAEARRELIAVERAARQHLQAEVDDLKAHVARLSHLVEEFRRARFGRASEKLDPDQLALALEDIEVAIGEVEEAEAQRTKAAAKPQPDRPKRQPRALPKHLPEIERVIEPDSICCPCGCGDMVRIGESLPSGLIRGIAPSVSTSFRRSTARSSRCARATPARTAAPRSCRRRRRRI